MSKPLPNNHSAPAGANSGDVAEKLRRSRQRLLDLTLRNRLLNFRPGNPSYRDDLKAHKHVVLKAHLDFLWEHLVEEERLVEIVGLTRDQQAQIAQGLRFRSGGRPSTNSPASLSLVTLGHEEWEGVRGSIRGVSQYLQKGNLVSLLPEEGFRKRLTKIRNEQNTLANSTGDSALFLAIGFLEWCEPEPHPRANEPLFAPLVLVHVNLDQRRTEEGGEREFLLHMDADQPQGNPCLAEKLRQDFAIDLPDLDEDEAVNTYFSRVNRALRTRQSWRLHPTIALGFFNFARYRLWLDLNPGEWPEGKAPTDHPIVSAILHGEPLPQQNRIPGDEEVASHQETEDLPIVLDSDSTQYAAILAAQKGVSMVVQGPPGSGKSQTITNLIAVAIAQGKKVLFVAQKLPALQVVRRRLEAVELMPFCLPLFSDKARVTELHRHLAGSARLRENLDWRRSLDNQVVALAKKLNGHAARLRQHPTGFNESACSLIQRAVALNLMLREAWGNEWNDELLVVSVPEVEPTPDWLEKRVQTLHQWNRLKAEVGSAWSSWSPLELGPMDTQLVEAAVRELERSAAALNEQLSNLPQEFQKLVIPQAEQLVSQVSDVRFMPLSDVLHPLLEFLWQAPQNAAAVARLERDLEEFHRQLAKAQEYLRLADGNRNYVVSRAGDALDAVVSVVSPNCSLGAAKASLDDLNDILRWAEDLSAYANLYPAGIYGLWHEEQQSPDGAVIAWKHLDLLASQRVASDLRVPGSSKMKLASYVLDDANKQSEARALAQILTRYHASQARLASRVADSTPFEQGIVPSEFEEAARVLARHSFGGVRVCELLDVEQNLLRLAELVAQTISKTPKDLASDVFGHPVLKVQDMEILASLADVPASLLRMPVNGTEGVLTRLIGNRSPAVALQALTNDVQAYQRCFEELSTWIPDIQAGQRVTPDVLDSQRQAARIIRDLGLENQPIEAITQLSERIGKLRKAAQAVVEVFEHHFEPWPLLPPENLGQVQQAKNLFLLLVNRPQGPAELSAECLCTQANADIIFVAMAESRALQHFRERCSDKIVFRNTPDLESITTQRRVLGSFAGCWWRWFSPHYHRTRKAVRSCLKQPYPSDEGMLSILAELETHEKRRLAFQDSPVAAVIGRLFQGIETKWQSIEPTLAWIQQLRSATQLAEVTPFVRSADRNTEGLLKAITSIEILAQLIDQDRKEFAAISPLSVLGTAPQTVSLQKLCAILGRVEVSANDLARHIAPQVELQPQATFKELVDRIEQLNELEKLTLALHKQSNIVQPSDAAKLSTSALADDVKWLSDLAQHKVPSMIVDAVLGEKLELDQHSALIHAAREFSTQMGQFLEGHSMSEPVFRPPLEAPAIDLGELLKRLVGATISTRSQAVQWKFHSHLTLSEICESFDDAHEIRTGVSAFGPWREILREEPSLLPADQITTTLDWLHRVRQHGASGSLLRWILAEETDNRVHWWQELVSRAKDFRSRVRGAQDHFVLPLHEAQPTMGLATWLSQTADRVARTTSALEVVGSFSQSSDFTVHDLAQATASLRRAIQVDDSLQSWRERLGEDATRIPVVRIQTHRQWAALTRGLPSPIGEWLVATDTTSRSEILLGIRTRLIALKEAIRQTQVLFGSFGQVWGDGPFAVLSTSGTPEEVEFHCLEFIDKLPLLPHYAALLREQEAARKLGLSNLLKYAEKARISTEVLILTFRGAVTYQLAKAVWESDDHLRYFQSTEYERLRQKFKDDDEKQLKTNRRFIKTLVGNADVTEGWKGRTAGEHTEYALLQHEMGKQRRHLPIRKLVHRAGRAMQDLCPCWMMTPLAVAQFLAPGALSFDLVIMDEASQINPEDAWGAIARGKQVIVVGDQKQMPPSDFFMSALEEDESPEEDEQIDGGKSESILDASVASLLSCPLLWHYRSRQEMLIAPANSFSYDNRLILFPHPDRSDPELGIRYTHIPSATATTGKVTNTVEADAVAKRVHELAMREYAKPPASRLTIGVVTMNLYQQDCVMDLLEKMRQDDPRFDLAMTALASEQNEEPLFVRNLENIQGDERDIMILSCTYGPHTPGGTPTQRFGPLNREGGERRFNVLITRAKWRMEVFSSIRSDQILVDGRRQGVRDFHLFLKYAESGQLPDRGEATGRQSDSPFETQVEAVLQRAGFQTERQVGVAGYFVDLAVKHPRHAGLFALGVECDGKTYHSSRAARDRDRLREKVLMERGWKLHRIWSTDWFVNPQQAKKRLIDAVKAACR